MKKILWVILGAILILPVSVAFAADWVVGADSSGNFGFAVGSNGTLSGGWGLANPYGLPSGSIFGIISNLLFWLLSIFGILGIIGFVISGILYLTAAGDDHQIERAKDAMKWSIIGIIVGLAGFVIINAVFALLSGTSNKF